MRQQLYLRSAIDVIGPILVGCGVHVALLSIPLVAAAAVGGLSRPVVPVVVVFLGLATLLCCGEALATAAAHRLPTQLGDAPLIRLAQLNGLVLLGLFLTGICLRTFSGNAGWGVVELLGIGAFCAGCLLRFTAMQALGAWFRTEGVAPEHHPLQTRGLFAVVRHPSEVGLLLIVVGASLLLDARLVLFAAPIQFAITLRRTKLEDRLLEATHGAKHREYAARVASLAPLIY